MKPLLLVGAGDIAQRALPWLLGRFHVIALIRRPEKAAALRALGVRVVMGDLDQPSTLNRLAGLACAVLYCAPPPGEGDDDRRMQAFLAALSRRAPLPQRWVYISTTGVYGDYQGALITETAPALATEPRSRRRLAAEARLRAFGCRHGLQISILRAPGIYAHDRLPLERLRARGPVLCEEEDVYTSHIHADDLAMAACLALFRGKPNRVYNVVDFNRMKVGQWFESLASALGFPPPQRIAKAMAAHRLSAQALSFMQASRQIDNHRVCQELRLRLSYPDLACTLAHPSLALVKGPLSC
jgi:nucleoside-diphosphate-sugar epimerase